MYDQKKKKTKMDIFASYKADITQATGYKEHCRETVCQRIQEESEPGTVTQIICGDLSCILLPQWNCLCTYMLAFTKDSL